MPDTNCTVHYLVIPVTGLLNISQLLAILNGTLIHQTQQKQQQQLQDALESSTISFPLVGKTTLTLDNDDAMSKSQDAKNDVLGAAKFTVAVVLLYGVGVILMLGFHFKKSTRRTQESSERDATQLVKALHRNRSKLNRKYHKAKIESQVRDINSTNLTEILISSDKEHQDLFERASFSLETKYHKRSDSSKASAIISAEEEASSDSACDPGFFSAAAAADLFGDTCTKDSIQVLPFSSWGLPQVPIDSRHSNNDEELCYPPSKSEMNNLLVLKPRLNQTEEESSGSEIEAMTFVETYSITLPVIDEEIVAQ